MGGEILQEPRGAFVMFFVCPIGDICDRLTAYAERIAHRFAQIGHVRQLRRRFQYIEIDLRDLRLIQ